MADARNVKTDRTQRAPNQTATASARTTHLELGGTSTAYDAAYVALAEVLGCELLTADQRLSQAPGPRCPIRLLY